LFTLAVQTNKSLRPAAHGVQTTIVEPANRTRRVDTWTRYENLTRATL